MHKYFLTKDCVLCVAIVVSDCSRSMLKRSKLQDFLSVEHALRPPTMLFIMRTANHILHAQQSPLVAPFPSLISRSAHSNHYCSLTPEALPTLAAIKYP